MPRLEAAIDSPLTFRRQMSEGTAPYVEPPETVAIDFDGRQFVWHAIAEDDDDPIFGAQPTGPTVTSVLGTDSDEHVATELERFLSVLTYLYQVPAEVAHYGSSWTDDPFAVPTTRGPRVPGWARKEPLSWISLQREPPELLKALAWYREGKNAGSPFYRFFAHSGTLWRQFFET